MIAALWYLFEFIAAHTLLGYLDLRWIFWAGIIIGCLWVISDDR